MNRRNFIACGAGLGVVACGRAPGTPAGRTHDAQTAALIPASGPTQGGQQANASADQPIMVPNDSVAELNAFAASKGTIIKDCTPRSELALMFAFYEQVQASCCRGPGGDMLLFQWSTFNWGNGHHFELNLTRQFDEDKHTGDEALSQLSLTFLYMPTTATTALGEGNRWCDDHASFADFRRFAYATSAYLALADASAQRVDLTHSYV